MTKILAVSGSLRSGSFNTALLRVAQRHAPTGVTIELYDELESLAPYNEDRETDRPESVDKLFAKVEAADALLIATPEFNNTLPGQLKHLIDWGSRPYGPEAKLYGKPVAVIGASKSPYGAVWAQDQVRKALGIAGARVTDVEMGVGDAHEKFDENGELNDTESFEQLQHVVRELAEQHRQVPAL
jgi:chromate reductase